jgi:serine/threonine protein kinase
MDWGLAKVLGQETPATGDTLPPEQTRAWTEVSPTPEAGSHTQAGSLVGTPAFIPPEQAAGELGKVDERADVFGLGALLAAILTGKPPYIGESFEAVRVLALRGKLVRSPTMALKQGEPCADGGRRLVDSLFYSSRLVQHEWFLIQAIFLVDVPPFAVPAGKAYWIPTVANVEPAG